MREYSLPYSEKINVAQLAQLFNNMSESYKIFWFRAIFKVILDRRTSVSYGELINNMIIDAWYKVSEYKLNLGPSDNLERLILYVQDKLKLQSNIKSSELKKKLDRFDDAEYKRMKRSLIENVPYRLQAPLLPDLKGRDWNVGNAILSEKINQHKNLIYYFERLNSFDTVITFQNDWCDYIFANQAIIQGWIEYNMIAYLQRRNPNIPGIINKIYPPEKRNLNEIRKLWKLCIEISPINEIYKNTILTTETKLSIDHYIPWSYVANDEMWNLHPTLDTINSSKHNYLPDWDKYFKKFSFIEYNMFKTAQVYEKARIQFEKCRKAHVNDINIASGLYNDSITEEEFYHKLGSIIRPLYESAQNMGFEVKDCIGA